MYFKPTLLCLLIAAPIAQAQDSVAQAMEMVRDTCQTAKDEGSFSSLTAKGQVEGNIRVKLVGKLGADAFIELNEEEWTSIRQVVRTDQLADNQDYRACVQALTPVVLEKMP
jgi:hypothetical protein